MDIQQPWGDFHFLNTAFTDVVAANMNFGAKQWIQTSLVRLFYRGARDSYKTANRTVQVIDGLSVEYAIPFPLTYIVQPTAINTYGEIFVFLLQIRRAKSVLERTLVRGSERGKKPNAEMKVFYAMGNRLTWIIK
jgi:gamma-tubulin complex component 5